MFLYISVSDRSEMLCLFDVHGDIVIVTTMIYHTIEQQEFMKYLQYRYLIVNLMYTTTDIDRFIYPYNRCYVDMFMTCLNVNVQQISWYGYFNGYVNYVRMIVYK